MAADVFIGNEEDDRDDAEQDAEHHQPTPRDARAGDSRAGRALDGGEAFPTELELGQQTWLAARFGLGYEITKPFFLPELWQFLEYRCEDREGGLVPTGVLVSAGQDFEWFE